MGGRYNDRWHQVHLKNPRALVPESNMPAYPWLERTQLVPESAAPKMIALRRLGHPYSDEEIAKAADELRGKTELDALIAYLQGLGTALKPAH